MEKESHQIPFGEIWWANSNVIESIFGKYKLFLEKSPLQEVSKFILTIPLCTVEITGPFIKNALETISITDVERWANSVFEKSTLSKKRTLLKAVKTSPKNDTKVAGKMLSINT